MSKNFFIALEKTETALENYLVFNHGIDIIIKRVKG